MFVVHKQNDGNSKLIISAFFFSLLLHFAAPSNRHHTERHRAQFETPPPSPSGAIYVVDELDFETKQNYDLIVRATDSVSGVYAEVPLSIAVSGT